jgi:hypothetical protein
MKGDQANADGNRVVVDSTIHPDTGEPVLLPFRMSAFVPTNLIVVAGMLMPNPTVRIAYDLSLYNKDSLVAILIVHEIDQEHFVLAMVQSIS